MSDTEAPAHTNRLIDETSPYLLQHAHNPVDWYPWGPEALERAKKEDRPILLSIGYAACHWCHVMERESFEDEDTAKLMNDGFVCIKVDREERPDIDDIYMAATVAMSGGGGWPMTVMLTPDREPFFAGTYFPPEDKYGRPGFKSLLRRIRDLWQTDRDRLHEQAKQLTEHVREQSTAVPAMNVSGGAIERAVRVLGSQFDEEWGGFGSAPKFPPCAALSLLMRHHARTRDARALEMVRGTLDGMRRGGMYDHVGGGFARYSTDERWLAPHFEKMLYDNAQLTKVYLEAHQLTGSDDYRGVAAETLDYIVREMQDERGGYYSATDADSEGVEGKFFVWAPEEIEEILGKEEAERFNEYYDIRAGGNWEGVSIANTPRGVAEVASELGISPSELEESVERSRKKVYEARRARVPPLLDDKILTAWNGLMIGAMAEGHRVLGDERYLASATRAAEHALEHLVRDDGGLFRTARGGKAHLDAYLEDYAYLTDGLIDLYEAGAPSRFLVDAVRLAERMLEDFGDPDGGAFFQTAHGHEALLVRTREGHDGAVPNPNAVAARALARLSYHLDRDDFRSAAAGAVRAYGRLIARQPRAFATTLGVVDLLLEGPVELVLVGKAGDADARALGTAVAQVYLPNRIVAHVDRAEEKSPIALPLTEGKTLIDGKAALYVCRGFTCEAPITSPEEVPPALEAGAATAREGRSDEIGARRLDGHATADGTARYAARLGGALSHGFTKLGSTDLSVCRIGFGGYRIDEGALAHREALEAALTRGANLVDTSTNYTDGRSERLIGEALASLVRGGKLARDEIVVVSKIGYVQGANLEIAREREESGKPFEGMVQYQDGCWHCVHPEWLGDQLTRSLTRLGLETLDVCLLHNPEYFFSDAVKRGRGPLAELRDEFYRRLTEAFRHFEREVERGRIRFYGVSSNTSTSPADDREATELARMLEAARSAGGDAHHFRVLQLPMNLREVGAAFEKNNADGQRTVLEEATASNVAVLVNRPLNAIEGGGLLRLADPPMVDKAPPFDAQLSKLERLESEYRREIASNLRAAPGASFAPETLFNWSDQLARMPSTITSLEHWSELENNAIAPRVVQVMQALDRVMSGPAGERWREWRGRYLPELEGLFAALRQRAAERSRARARAITEAIAPELPSDRRGDPLSQKALATLASTPGVTTVLVGMRDTSYVDDALATLKCPPLNDPAAILRAGSEARVPGG